MKKLTFYLFLIILLFFMGLGIIMPLRKSYSELEKRELSKFPDLTINGVLTGDYFTEITKWYLDTYPVREDLIKNSDTVSSLFGLPGDELHGTVIKEADEIPTENNKNETKDNTKDPLINKEDEEKDTKDNDDNNENVAYDMTEEEPEAAGTVYIKGDRACEVYYFSKENSDNYAAMLNFVRSRLPHDVTMYELIAPTAFGVILDEDIQKSLGGSSEADAISYIYGCLDEDIITIDTIDDLKKKSGEYIYFRTDHHWTADGAYIAYKAFCREKGIKENKKEAFLVKTFDGFLGTYYAASNKSKKLSDPDVVTAYVPIATNTMFHITPEGESFSYPIISDVSNASAGNKYSCFIDGDNPYTEIKNEKLNDGSAILLIKESYGNAFSPFLVDHYENVYIIDYRMYKDSAIELIKEKNIKDVLFLNNMEAFSNTHTSEMRSIFN